MEPHTFQQASSLPGLRSQQRWLPSAVARPPCGGKLCHLFSNRCKLVSQKIYARVKAGAITLFETEDDEGQPMRVELDPDEYEVVPKAIDTDELLADLDKLDERRAPTAPVAVPSSRLVVDEEELDLIGDGLPIIQGVSWLP